MAASRKKDTTRSNSHHLLPLVGTTCLFLTPPDNSCGNHDIFIINALFSSFCCFCSTSSGPHICNSPVSAIPTPVLFILPTSVWSTVSWNNQYPLDRWVAWESSSMMQRVLPVCAGNTTTQQPPCSQAWAALQVVAPTPRSVPT